MKTTLIILLLMVVGVTLLLFVMGMVSRSGESPGLLDGRLTRCPERPNCVCSEYAEDSNHYVQPVQLPAGAQDWFTQLMRSVIEEMGGRVVVEQDGYLAATFRSALFGFTDDLELRMDPQRQLLHIRSGSRVGYSDSGVNGRRVDQLKKRIEAKRLSAQVKD